MKKFGKFFVSEKHERDRMIAWILNQAMLCTASIWVLKWAIILKKSNPRNPGGPRGLSRWRPHSSGFKFYGELQTLIELRTVFGQKLKNLIDIWKN